MAGTRLYRRLLGPDHSLVVPSLHSPGLKSSANTSDVVSVSSVVSQLPSSCKVWGFPPPTRAAGPHLKGQLPQAAYSRAEGGGHGPQGEGQLSWPPAVPMALGHRGPTPAPVRKETGATYLS